MSKKEREILALFGIDASSLPVLIEPIRQAEDRIVEARRKAEREFTKQATKRRLLCPSCGNQDDNEFEEDESRGQVTCTKCGTCVKISAINDTEWVRQYEGEVNPSFHGPPPDEKFSAAYNLRTGFAQGDLQPKTIHKELAQIQAKIDMGESSGVANREKRTRQEYKDHKKMEAVEKLKEFGDKLQLHERVIDRAATLYAQYRQETEVLRNANGCCCAALIMAQREAASAGSKRQADDSLAFRCDKCSLQFGSKKELRYHTCET